MFKEDSVASRHPNLFPKKNGLKREPPQNLHPHVPQREAEAEEFIDEYSRTAEPPHADKKKQPSDRKDDLP
jgi:hypothetical protein